MSAVEAQILGTLAGVIVACALYLVAIHFFGGD